jgi:hypothetical protein
MSWIKQTRFLILFVPNLFYSSSYSSEIASYCNICHISSGVLKREFYNKDFYFILRRLKVLRDSKRDTLMHGYLEEFDDHRLYLISKELEIIYNK